MINDLICRYDRDANFQMQVWEALHHLGLTTSNRVGGVRRALLRHIENPDLHKLLGVNNAQNNC